MRRIVRRRVLPERVEIGLDTARPVGCAIMDRGGPLPMTSAHGFVEQLLQPFIKSDVESLHMQFVLLDRAAAFFPVWIHRSGSRDAIESISEKANDMIVANIGEARVRPHIFFAHNEKFCLGRVSKGA